jgi:predicted nucleotidyltransferase
MRLKGFDNLPSEVVAQINRVVDIWKKHLNNQLVGVYLHGSIVLNSFLPRSSDIDLLVVVEDSLDISTKLDVTSYIKLICQCGIVLYGRDINEVFSDIADKDFWKAISADIENYNFHNYAPRYFSSNILILGRILSFNGTKRILSKYDAGLWMIFSVPDNLKYLPELAMKIWYEGEQYELPEDDLEELRKYLIEEIKK